MYILIKKYYTLRNIKIIYLVVICKSYIKEYIILSLVENIIFLVWFIYCDLPIQSIVVFAKSVPIITPPSLWFKENPSVGHWIFFSIAKKLNFSLLIKTVTPFTWFNWRMEAKSHLPIIQTIFGFQLFVVMVMFPTLLMELDPRLDFTVP